MKIHNINDRIKSKKEGIIVLGYFDSFHLGHQKMVSELIRISNEKNKDNFVLTYKNLHIKRDGKMLLSLDNRIELIRQSGVKNIILVDFDKDFNNMTGENFLSLIKNNFNITEFIIGDDFHFGKDRAYNIETLTKNGMRYNKVEPLFINGKKISSSLVKEAVLNGDMRLSKELIGRNFFLEGIVQKGKQLGRKLGFPTMNINNCDIIYPKAGVYITKTFVYKDKKVYYSMTFVSKDIMECYLFEYEKFSYNFKIKVDFLDKIRDNLIFNNIDDLKEKIKGDFNFVKSYFNI